MPHPVRSVLFNDGTHENIFAIIQKELPNGNLNLEYHDPDTGAGQIATDIPEGAGGRTWRLTDVGRPPGEGRPPFRPGRSLHSSIQRVARGGNEHR